MRSDFLWFVNFTLMLNDDYDYDYEYDYDYDYSCQCTQLTKASNTSVSKVSLSEFSIMMLKSASSVSCRNWRDKGGGR